MACRVDPMPEPDQVGVEYHRAKLVYDEITTGHPIDQYAFQSKPYLNVSEEELNQITAKVCDMLKFRALGEIKNSSLELQFWWREHQQMDAAREAAEKRQQEQTQRRLDALAKLTPEDRKILGV